MVRCKVSRRSDTGSAERCRPISAWPVGRRENQLDLQSLANLGEFIGGVAVVVTVGYLALQIRQNTQSVRTENYARALERVSAMQARLAQDGELANLLTRGAADHSQLSSRERVQFLWCMSEYFGAVEFIYLAWKAGAIPEEIWDRWSSTTAWWLSQPGIRSCWHGQPVPFTASFTSFVESIAADDPPDPIRQERFLKFLAGHEPKNVDAPAAARSE